MAIAKSTHVHDKVGLRLLAWSGGEPSIHGYSSESSTDEHTGFSFLEFDTPSRLPLEGLVKGQTLGLFLLGLGLAITVAG